MFPEKITRQPASRALVLLALLAAVLLVYAPYLTLGLRSSNASHDGYAYHVIVADALVQCRAGVFPVYVGQSAWRYNGGTYPQIQAPLLTTAACVLDGITARTLPAAGVLNALLVLAALGAAAGMYRTLLELSGGETWAASFLALAFVLCPGVLGLVLRLDMVMSLLALPFLPWVWLALWRIWNGEGWRASLLLGASLALVLMGHPPIALWTAVALVVAGIAGLASTRRGWITLPLGAVFALLAAAWPLALAFVLGGNRAAQVGVADDLWRSIDPQVAGQIAETVGSELPGALLPVGWLQGPYGNDMPAYGPGLPSAWASHAWTPYLQLGYALWVALFFSVWWLRRARDRRLASLLVGVACVCLFLFPLPFVTALLWKSLPSFFDITRAWPAQRLYPILASLAAGAGAVAWGGWCRTASGQTRRRMAVFGVAMGLWPMLEGLKFTSFALHRPVDLTVSRVENSALRFADLQMSAPRRMPLYGDPILQQRVLRRNGVLQYDNATAVATRCAQAEPIPVRTAELVALVVEPGRRLAVCVRSDTQVVLKAVGPDFLRIGGADAGRLGVLPLWTSGTASQQVSLELQDPQSGARLSWPNAALRTVAYSPDELPVRVRSVFPYRVDLDVPRPGLRLETSRLCVPGYAARVNAHEVGVGCSDDGYVTLPLALGLNEVALDYIPPHAVRASFWVSLITLVATVLVSFWRRRPAPAAG